MSPVLLRFVLSLFAAHEVICTAIASRRYNRDVSSLESFHLYPRPAYLPIMPYYEVDIPQQEGKFFGVMAATRYETVSIIFLKITNGPVDQNSIYILYQSIQKITCYIKIIFF